MRMVLFFALALACTSDPARASERYSGFLTLGCGDSYIKTPTVPETWFVNMTSSQRQAMFAQADIEHGERSVWWTLYVEIEGRLENKRKHGYFFDHAKELIVERFIVARIPEPGETVQAATEPASMHRGYLIVGPESQGFVDEKRRDEYWWVVPGKGAQEKIGAYFYGKDNILDRPRLENLFIEFAGRAGPPGTYLNDANREVAIPDFKIVRRNVEPEELLGTAAMDPPGSGAADINKCKPQRR
jgi:hypothetical protein